jgi:hypothetical protein
MMTYGHNQTKLRATYCALGFPLGSGCREKALVYEDLSNPYGIAGTLLHVQVSQSYLSKPVSILLSFLSLFISNLSNQLAILLNNLSNQLAILLNPQLE